MNTSTFTSLVLKLSGLIFIVSFLTDVLILPLTPDPFPYNFTNSQWQLALVTAWVDRGVVPLIGITLVLVGYWIDSIAKDASPKKSKIELRLPIFILSSVFGILYILMIPVHWNNINQIKNQTLTQIEQGVGQGEQQIQSYLAQVQSLSQNPQQLNQQIAQRTQVIESGQFQGQTLSVEQLQTLRQQREQLINLRELSKNPKEFKQKVEEIKNQLNTTLQERQKKARDQAQLDGFKQFARIAMQAMLLAIGFAVIGWLGLSGSRKLS
ncbi:HpsJ family protein [Pannus brasiliensis CCIBt3594]|uniref:HpsJ family protein n=1 Tax=Pannus brasiliensis CCIBt3594 TaxID=1427578 RepID=A0AAW9QX16_9CHRO